LHGDAARVAFAACEFILGKESLYLAVIGAENISRCRSLCGFVGQRAIEVHDAYYASSIRILCRDDRRRFAIAGPPWLRRILLRHHGLHVRRHRGIWHLPGRPR
jgi:hypothetical protein